MPPLLPRVLDLGAAGRLRRSRCTRSPRAAPAREPAAAPTCTARTSNVRSANRVMWETFACSGATTANVLPRSLGGVPQGAGARYDGKTQIDSASLARANLVTLTLGGNDAGYVDVLVTCGLGNCNTRAFERSRAAIIARTEAAPREGLPRDRGEGAARPHPRPRLSPPVPSREGTAGLPRAEPVPGGAGHVAPARDAPQRDDRLGGCHGRPLGCAGSRSSRWRAGSRATRSVAARARGSTGSSRARPGSG